MSDTLLDYALLTTPPLLQAGTCTKLTLVVSNPSDGIVRVASITMTLLVGTNARDLAAGTEGIQSSAPKGWGIRQNAGEFTLTPNTAEAGMIGSDSVSFVFSGVEVNDQPGTTLVDIREDAAYEDEPPAEVRKAELPLAKFPRQFQVSELNADKLGVDPGKTVKLQWTGTPSTSDPRKGPVVTYHIQYSPGNRKEPVDEEVWNEGPYTSVPLFRLPYVVFTLVVSVVVPDQSEPLVVQRQRVVEVTGPVIDRFDVLPAIVPVNGVARLKWQTSNAASVIIQPGTHKAGPAGTLYVQVPETRVFTLIALDAAGEPVMDQRTVTTSPLLKVNDQEFDFSGNAGVQGLNEVKPRPDYVSFNAQRGGPGGPGGTANVQVGPLDLTGATGLVRGAFARGGDGGGGGNANSLFGTGRGGDGGPGGNLTVEFGAQAGPPAQLIVDVSGGKGGPGGRIGSLGFAKSGRTGPSGHVTFVDAGPSRKAAVRRLIPVRGDTLLGYGLLDDPEPEGQSTLTLAESGGVPGVESISVPLPLLSRPDDWTAAEDGGMTTLTPPPGPVVPAATFTFLHPASVPRTLVVRERAGSRTRTAEFALAGTRETS